MRRALLQEGHFNSYSTELLNLNPFISLLRQNRLALFHRMITFTNCECKNFFSWFWNWDRSTEARLPFGSACYAPCVLLIMCFSEACKDVQFFFRKHTKAQVTYGVSWWWHSLPRWVARILLHCKPWQWGDRGCLLPILSTWRMIHSLWFSLFLQSLLAPYLSSNQSVNTLSQDKLILNFPWDCGCLTRSSAFPVPPLSLCPDCCGVEAK